MTSHFLTPISASDPAGTVDRRVTKRKLCRVSGLLFVQGYTTMPIKTVDVSTTGVALLLPQALPNGTVCDVTFHLHTNGLLRRFVAKIEVSNTVFLHSDVRAGCHFVSLGEESRKTLADFMR